MKSTILARDLRVGDKICATDYTVKEVAREGNEILVQFEEKQSLTTYEATDPLFIYRANYGA